MLVRIGPFLRHVEEPFLTETKKNPSGGGVMVETIRGRLQDREMECALLYACVNVILSSDDSEFFV